MEIWRFPRWVEQPPPGYWEKVFVNSKPKLGKFTSLYRIGRTKNVRECSSKSRSCRIKCLNMRSISSCTRPPVFTSFARLKKVQLADDVKVNKTQGASAKIDLELVSSSVFDEINPTRWNIKRNFRIYCGKKLKRKNTENSHVMFEFYWRQKQPQAEVNCIENTQLHEIKQLEEELPDVCDEESEERSEWMMTSKNTWNINFHFKKERRRNNFRICCGIKWNRSKTWNHGKLVCHVSNQSSFEF